MTDRTRFLLLAGAVLAAAACRLLPHPPNFAPVTAMALFAGATLADRWLAVLVPLAAMLLSDLALGVLRQGDPLAAFHGLVPVVYGSLAAIVGLGMLLRGRRRLVPVFTGTLAASLLFFALTNLAVWALTPGWPGTLAGLVACYTAALPFLHNALAGDLFFAALLFGGLALAERRSLLPTDPLARAPASRAP